MTELVGIGVLRLVGWCALAGGVIGAFALMFEQKPAWAIGLLLNGAACWALFIVLAGFVENVLKVLEQIETNTRSTNEAVRSAALAEQQLQEKQLEMTYAVNENLLSALDGQS